MCLKQASCFVACTLLNCTCTLQACSCCFDFVCFCFVEPPLLGVLFYIDIQSKPSYQLPECLPVNNCLTADAWK